MELSKSRIKIYSSLAQSKFRKRHSLFIAEGDKCVRDVCGNFEIEAIIATPEWIGSNPNICQRSENIYESTSAGIKMISGLSTPSSVIAVCRIPPEDTHSTTLLHDRLYLMLDGVQDPGNLGTIIRTAHWFGITEIFISPSSADIYNPKTVQSTMGSLGKVSVTRADLADIIKKNPGLPVYGLMLEGENIYNSELTPGGIIVMGNEGQGLSKEIRALIDKPLLIPPYAADNHSESLNVATATGVTLALFRARI